MYLVLLLFYLTTERSLFDQSCQLPDFLATVSCQGTFLCSELSTILNLCDWVISDFCKLRLLKWLRDLFSYLTVQLWFLCKLVLDIFPARATQYSPWYLTYFWHTSTLDLAPSMILQLHALVRLTSCIWSTTYNNSYRFSVVSTSLIVRFIPQAYTVCLEI